MFPFRRPLLTLLATAFVGLLAFACAGGGPGKLVIAVQPTATAQELSAQAGELEKFLEERLGVNVEIRFPTTYAGVIEALRFGHADAAFLSAWPAALAQREAGAEVVLAEVREVTIGDEKTEAPYYFSYWVVPQDSPYSSLAELRGKKVAFPSPLSTSGYVGPVARLVELGLLTRETGKKADPGRFFGEVFFAGGYAQAWQALKAGQVDVTVIAGDVPEELYREVLANTRVLEEQGPLPSHAVVFSKGLKEPLRSQLREALLELGSPEYRDLMRRFVSGIFVRFQATTTEEHLGSLNRFLDSTGLVFAEPQQAGAQPTTGVEAQERPLATPVPGSTQVKVQLGEWFVRPEVKEVAAGKVYFLAENTGEDPHELVIVRTDLPEDRLPVEEGRVDERQVEVVGRIDPFPAGTTAAATFDLAAGRYVLICNIVEVEPEEAEVESHYLLGMHTVFTVR